jgi:hypothetical protein
MLRVIIATVLSGLLLGGVPQALAVPIEFAATLTGDAERPTPVVTPGTGFSTVTIDTAAHTLRVQISFDDLLGLTTAAHIHAPINPATETAPVATQVPFFVGFPIGVTSGSYDHTFDTLDLATYNPAFVTANGGTAASAEAALLGFLLAGDAYVNVHSNLFAAGEIRGDLVQVPEPAAFGLLLAGLGFAGIARARRRR